MGRRKPGKYPFDYTDGDDRRFADSGVGGTLRVLHGPGRGMGVTGGVACRVEVLAVDGDLLDESGAGKSGKEHRLHGTVPGAVIRVAMSASYGSDGNCGCGTAECDPVLDELTAAWDVVLTGDLGNVVRFGVGPGWEEVVAIDTGEIRPDVTVPSACRWGAEFGSAAPGPSSRPDRFSRTPTTDGGAPRIDVRGVRQAGWGSRPR